MRIESIDTSSQFEKHYRKLPKKIKTAAKQKEALFRADPFSPALETHKLHGKDAGAWAFSINRKYRIKFLFLFAQSILFLDVGTHNLYT